MTPQLSHTHVLRTSSLLLTPFLVITVCYFTDPSEVTSAAESLADDSSVLHISFCSPISQNVSYRWMIPLVGRVVGHG